MEDSVWDSAGERIRQGSIGVNLTMRCFATNLSLGISFESGHHVTGKAMSLACEMTFTLAGQQRLVVPLVARIKNVDSIQ